MDFRVIQWDMNGMDSITNIAIENGHTIDIVSFPSKKMIIRTCVTSPESRYLQNLWKMAHV